MSAINNNLKRTALYEKHVALGARLGAFAGFEMPLWYTGIKEEHLAVREKVGLFDLSHMGEFFLKGRQAFDLVQHLTCNDVRRIGDGQCQYTLFPTPEGGVVDDLIVYQFNPEEYMLVVNASNIEKDLAWVVKNNTFDCTVTDRSDELTLVAVQGPKTNDLLKSFGIKTIASQKAFTFRRLKVSGHQVIVAGTGYTGERGFELIVDNADATWLWDSLVAAGTEFEAQPIGLGARDTLRLEMAYSLYGHELSDSISVLEAGLDWTVRFGPEFIGRDYLLKQKEQGLERIVAGLVVQEKRGAPRHAAPVYANGGREIGTVTSGSFSPSLDKGIGLALISPEFAEIGSQVAVDIRGKRVSATIVEIPFYSPKK
ncbi:glycine cleavage system aminomethyltransferase GcvT [bacterium]|nr:glycine cleavage system aminomethyltransferase GcvT [bacterium]